jgi:NAD(P)-dependent dehydrogenase (short-subunit alcohol dehydrogenase family)
MKTVTRSVVVTGSSTGIGWGITKVLIKKGIRVFGSVRKQADADRLQAEFGTNFVPLMFDVTDSGAVIEAAKKTSEMLDGWPLLGLVNNAGIAVSGPLLYLDIDEFRRQLEVNVTGPLIVTQAFASLLMSHTDRDIGAGRIVMISSIGGTSATPFVGPYNASKFALEGLSEALRRELMLLGIDVIVIAPGAVATPIWDKADQVDVTRYANTPYAAALDNIRKFMLEAGRKGLKPERIGQAAWRALTTAKPKTRYIVTPEPVQHFLVNNLPKRMVDRIIGGRLGLLPKK